MSMDLPVYDDLSRRADPSRPDQLRLLSPRRVAIGMAALVAAGACLFALCWPAISKVREAAKRAQSQNNLKQLADGMQLYHQENGAFPPAAIFDSEGNPLLSWRVAILPYIGEQVLYDQFHLDEPWDSPANRPLLEKMPNVFKAPRNYKAFTTFYRVFHGPGAAFEGTKGIPVKDFKDGQKYTILIVEAGEAVPWTKPDELRFELTQPLPSLGGIEHGDESIVVALADGRIWILKPRDESIIRAAITRNGGETMPPNWD